jgi:replicative DNA helicase
MSVETKVVCNPDVDLPIPQSRDVAKSLLGGLLYDDREFDEVLAIITTPAAFNDAPCRTLFIVMRDLWRSKSRLDQLELIEELTRRDLLDKIGGKVFLNEVAGSVCDSLMTVPYAQAVQADYMRSEIMRACSRISENASKGLIPVTDVLAGASATFDGLVGTSCIDTAAPVAETLDQVLTDLRSGVPDGILTPFSELNQRTGGLHPGELIVVGARPSVGKTALGMSLWSYAAIELGIPALLFSLEMRREEITNRLISDLAEIPMTRIRGRYLTSIDDANIEIQRPKLKSPNLIMDCTGGIRISELVSRARALHRKKKVRLITVDYLQLIVGERQRTDNREVEVAALSRTLKGLAMTLNVPVVVLCQLNRQVEGRADGKPRLSDLRESGAIEQDADAVLLLAPKPDSDQVIIDIAKQRNGPKGEFDLYFDREYVRFQDK